MKLQISREAVRKINGELTTPNGAQKPVEVIVVGISPGFWCVFKLVAYTFISSGLFTALGYALFLLCYHLFP